MAKDSEIYTLHRYFIWANRMRIHFYDILNKKIQKTIPEGQFNIESFLYMSYWYGGLYVVIEGWRELGLVDKKIDALLNSSNVDLLKRYRNGVFHFQKKYYDKHFASFMSDGENCVEWIKDLNQEFSRYFLTFFNKNSESSPKID